MIKQNILFVLFLFKSVRLIPKYFKENRLSTRNIKNFILGNHRLYTFNQKPLYLKEQVWYRLSVADQECLNRFQCDCGCEILGLVMLEKSCEKQCYPILMDESTWNIYKQIRNKEELQVNFNYGKKYLTENFDLLN